MKVLHISFSDTAWGMGAAGRLLHEAGASYGVGSFMVVRYHFPGCAEYHVQRAAKMAEIVRLDCYKECDLVHLHGLYGYIRTIDLNALSGKPVIWSLEDSLAYTADCLLGEQCEQWKHGCIDCMMSKDESVAHQRAAYLQEKCRRIRGLNVTFTYANTWQEEQLAASGFKDSKRSMLPVLADESVFCPGSRKLARERLGLSLTSLIVIYHNELGGASRRTADYLRKVLMLFRDNINEVYLINLGSGAEIAPAPGFKVRNVMHMDAAMLGEYYRAANINLYFSGIDAVYRPVREAALCALPSAVFDWGPAKTVIEGGKDGFLLKPFDEKQLQILLGRSLTAPGWLINFGRAALQKARSLPGDKKAAEAYFSLYQQVLGQQARPLVDDMAYNLQDYKAHIADDVKRMLRSGWEKARLFLGEKLEHDFAGKSQQERNQYVDMFAWAAIAYTDWRKDQRAIWKLVLLWREMRALNETPVFFSREQQEMYLLWVRKLRDVLVDYFQNVKFAEFSKIVEKENLGGLLQVWRMVFLDVQSPLHLTADVLECPGQFKKLDNGKGYPFLFLKMMYVPYIDDQARVDVAKLMEARQVPPFMKLVTIFWMTSSPLYSGTALNRKVLLENIGQVCDYLVKRHEPREAAVNYAFAGHAMVSLWRLSYLGGNNRRILERYGQFTQMVAGMMLPQYTKLVPKRKRKPDEKLRIGYISMNFRSQAVSQYMANRLKYADHEKFFIKTFVLQRYEDDMTKAIKSYSDEHEVFTNVTDIKPIARAIRESQLDLLVYTDIGMEVTTYLLASLRLAPVQAVLVGHGTTTGLSTVDYYVSGDHEPKNAQSHYVEKLIRLPDCGAAQMPPKSNDRVMTRRDIQVPESAVLFISCANGLKHGESRDELLIDILRKAPDAYLLLKPFMSPQLTDRKFSRRIMDKAKAAGVENRLKIMGPLPRPGDLMSLITLADIQLDTYPYGGWTTNLEALYYGLPIVTQEGDIARNRWGAGLLRTMGIAEGIAHNEREYVDWAVRFAKDAELRERVSRKIRENAQAVLFNGEKEQPDYEQVLVQMAESRK